MKKAIRTEYEELGVEEYYKTYADVYENPHFRYIKRLLAQNESRIDFSKVLDFSCGGGEVSLILRGLGYENFSGCDPFTQDLYFKNTGIRATGFSFEDVIKQKMTPSVLDSFSSIICCFAMHLCPEKQLYPLVNQLFTLSKNIIIITPHKRPKLEAITGVNLIFDDFAMTDRGKKIFLKSYELKSIE